VIRGRVSFAREWFSKYAVSRGIADFDSQLLAESDESSLNFLGFGGSDALIAHGQVKRQFRSQPERHGNQTLASPGARRRWDLLPRERRIERSEPRASMASSVASRSSFPSVATRRRLINSTSTRSSRPLSRQFPTLRSNSAPHFPSYYLGESLRSPTVLPHLFAIDRKRPPAGGQLRVLCHLGALRF